MDLNFVKEGNKWVATSQVSDDVKIQVIFAEGKVGTVSIGRSLDNIHFYQLGQSAISNCPIVQTEGLGDGDFIKVAADHEPQSYIAIEA
jgi:hypothetical protein